MGNHHNHSQHASEEKMGILETWCGPGGSGIFTFIYVLIIIGAILSIVTFG